MSEKRYQIFISSTFRDLVEERQAVLKAVLELNHMPAGMELFPATDESAWELITSVIDSSDYYVLIIGGRYGSTDEEGIGYTEKEYDYARKTKKPVIALLHKNPGEIARSKTEAEPDTWKKLESFRSKVELVHTCKYWCSVEDLKSQVILGLTSSIKHHPAIGWVRADTVPSGATLKDVLSLRTQIDKLEAELSDLKAGAPPGTEDLMQGDDVFEVKYTFVSIVDKGTCFLDKTFQSTIKSTWNEIFSEIAPLLFDYITMYQLERILKDLFESTAKNDLSQSKQFGNRIVSSLSFQQKDVHTCIVQLRALGLIKETRLKHGLNSTQNNWSLTSYGDVVMNQLRALKKSSPVERQSTIVSESEYGVDIADTSHS